MCHRNWINSKRDQLWGDYGETSTLQQILFQLRLERKGALPKKLEQETDVVGFEARENIWTDWHRMIFETTPILKAIAAVDICNRSFHQIKRWETTMRPKNGGADNFDPNEMTWRKDVYICNFHFYSTTLSLALSAKYAINSVQTLMSFKAIISSALVLILAVLTLHETFSYKTAISHRMHRAASSRHLARWWFRRKPSKHSHTRPSPSPCSALRGWTSAAPILVVRSHQGPPPITSPSITPKPIHLPTPQIPDNRFYPPLCRYLTPSRHNEEPHHPPPAPAPTPRLPPMGLGWGLPKPPLQVSLLIGEIQQAAFCFAGGKYASALTSSQCNFRSSTLIH